MNTLDSLFLAAEVLHANYTVADYLINAALHYGPGVILTAGVVTAWRASRWTLARYYQWADDRADRRHYATVAHRLHQVADNTDQIITAAGQHLAEQLRTQLYANDLEEEK
ncbi:MAG: hypothetical protein ACRDQ0_05280 [Pseudonocardia sp.]